MKSMIIWSIFMGLCFAQHLEDIINEVKCNILSGPGTYEKLKVSSETLRTCIYESFHTDTYQTEIHKVRTTGTLYKGTSRYGIAGKDLNVCLKNYVEIVKLCLTKEENTFFNTVMDRLHKSVDYVYENDGQGIIEFIEKGGFECVISRIGGMTKCYNNNIPCKDFEKFKTCLAQELEDKCTDTVSANITEELLQFVKVSICKDRKIKNSTLRRKVRDMSGIGHHFSHFEKEVMNECVEAGSSSYEELDETLNKMKNCLKEKKFATTTKSDYLANMNRCTMDAVKVFTTCLPEKLKYFPTFLQKLENSLESFFYDDFKEISGIFFPCGNELHSAKSQDMYRTCIKNRGVENEYEIPTSLAEFCKKFIVMGKCFTTQINETCAHNENVEIFSRDYIEAIEKPCKSAS